MTTAAGALDILVTADTAQASSSLSKFAASAEREMQRAERASQGAKRDLDRMTAGIQRQIDTFGLTGSEIQKYELRLKGASAAQLEMVDRLDRMKNAQAAFNAAANGGIGAGGGGIAAATDRFNKFGVSIGQTNAAMRQLPAQFTDVATQLAGGQNPLLILMQQGGQIKDSFGGVRPALAALGSYITPLAVGIGALALAGGGLALAFYQGHEESVALGKSLTLTGNYAGVTEGQFRAMAHAVATSSGATIGASRDIVQGLISTGNVGPTAIEPMADAIARLQKLSGEDTEKIVADFAKMGEGVTKWAAEHNKQYNYLTLGKYEYIRQLEEEGKIEEAVRENSKLLAAHFGGAMVQNLGTLETTLKTVGNAWRSFWDSAKDIGRAKTPEQRIAEIDAELAQGRRGGVSDSEPDPSVHRRSGVGADNSRSRLLGEREALVQAKLKADADAAAKSQETAAQKAGIAASNELKKIDDSIAGINRKEEAFKSLAKWEDAVRAAGGVVTDEEHARRVAKIEKDNAPAKGPRSPQAKLEDAFGSRMESFGADLAKLEAEADSMDLYGKAVNRSRVAVLEFDIAQGKLKGKGGAALTPGQIASARKAAEEADLQEELNNQQKATIADKARTESITAAANAQAMNARETKIATEIAGLQTKAYGENSEAFKEAAAERAAAINKEFDNKLKLELLAQKASNDAEVRKINEDADSIGMSSIERMKRDARRPAREKADRQIKDNPEQEAQIIAAMIAEQDALTEAIQRRYDKSRSADAGVSAALQKYQEEATNFAKSAETMTNKVLGGMEDGLTALFSGKTFNVKALIDSIIADFMRLYVVKPMLASIFGPGTMGGGALGGIFGGGGGWGGHGQIPGMGGLGGLFSGLGGLGGLFGGGAALPGAAAASGGGGLLTSVFDLGGIGFARGGRPPVGRVSVVGEEGPELFVPDSAGTVIPNSAMRGGGDSGQPVNVTNNFSVGAGVTRGDVMSLMQGYGASLKGEILGSIRNGGVFAR